MQLADDSVLKYEESFLPAELADRYFIELRDSCVWEEKVGPFGRKLPRLTSAYGDEGVAYRYSGTLNVAIPWNQTLMDIKQMIETVQGRYNFCLLNRYRSGQDSVGLHADDEPGMGNVIGSISLGATRTFRIRHNQTKETHCIAAGHGTLIIMAGQMQQFWKHEIPKTQRTVGERINLTYRLIG
ncbi:MAG: alpha-ketoglutarate-dependent dioxygenase AlkB [Planctomycetales bacterium]|nr:alpha-ketoglutarate-dependent dioxygenase AlkB [Planctomycetales bacterium]